MGRARWAGGEGEGERGRRSHRGLRHAPSRLPSTSQYVTFSALSLRTVFANDAPIAPPQPGCRRSGSGPDQLHTGNVLTPHILMPCRWPCAA